MHILITGAFSALCSPPPNRWRNPPVTDRCSRRASTSGSVDVNRRTFRLRRQQQSRRHDQTGAVERVSERQADSGRRGDFPSRERHGDGVSGRSPAVQGGERAAQTAPECGRAETPAAAR